MKKEMLILSSVVILLMSGCGSSKEEDNLVTVDTDIITESEDTDEDTDEETMENSSENQTISEKTDEETLIENRNNDLNAEIGKVRTALSDTGVQPQDLIGLPEGVAPEFTYYIYDTGFDGMIKAQQYLEQIGVSEEGKKLIALWKQDNTATPIMIEEYTFDDDTIYCVQHTFDSCEENYQKAIDDYGEDVIDYTDADAYYTRTVATEEPINYIRSYDTLVESLNDQYRTVIW